MGERFGEGFDQRQAIFTRGIEKICRDWCYESVPQLLMRDVVRYIEHGIVPQNDCLRAMFANDFLSVMGSATFSGSGRIASGLHGISAFIRNNAPHDSFGGYVKVAAWSEVGGLRGFYQRAFIASERERDDYEPDDELPS